MEENLLLNENAYIYKKPENYSLSKNKIKGIFRDATRDVNKVGRNLFEEEGKLRAQALQAEVEVVA